MGRIADEILSSSRNTTPLSTRSSLPFGSRTIGISPFQEPRRNIWNILGGALKQWPFALRGAIESFLPFKQNYPVPTTQEQAIASSVGGLVGSIPWIYAAEAMTAGIAPAAETIG